MEKLNSIEDVKNASCDELLKEWKDWEDGKVEYSSEIIEEMSYQLCLRGM